MQFTPELPLTDGRLRSLADNDLDALMTLYQHPELPGQAPIDPASEQARDQIARMLELSVQMAATQRGMMWAIEIGGEFVGMLSAYDWQPSLLRAALRVDALPQLTLAQRQETIATAVEFMASKYHLRTFLYSWIEGQSEDYKTLLTELGFEATATLRAGWRINDDTYADTVQFYKVLGRKEEGTEVIA